MPTSLATRSRAFTLIELLVVIAIISLLVSILLPSLHQARKLAKRAVCATNWRSAGTVAAMYQHDNNGEMPRNDSGGSTIVIYSYYDADQVGFGTFRPYVDHNGDWPGDGSGWLDYLPATIPGDPASADMMARGIFSDPASLLLYRYGTDANTQYVLGFTTNTWNSPPDTYPNEEVGAAGDLAVGTCCTERVNSAWAALPVVPYAHDYEGVNILRLDGHVLWRSAEELEECTKLTPDPNDTYKTAFND